MWRRFCAVATLSALFGACGGVVEGGSRQDGGQETPSTSPGKDPPASEDDTGSGLDDPNADTQLGDCKLGYAETYGKDCAWVADGRCYETREMACNCACPRDRNSQCASGFESGADGHVWVACR